MQKSARYAFSEGTGCGDFRGWSLQNGYPSYPFFLDATQARGVGDPVSAGGSCVLGFEISFVAPPLVNTVPVIYMSTPRAVLGKSGGAWAVTPVW